MKSANTSLFVLSTSEANSQFTYQAAIQLLQPKNLKCKRVVGIGFDGSVYNRAKKQSDCQSCRTYLFGNGKHDTQMRITQGSSTVTWICNAIKNEFLTKMLLV